jgi:gamma-glutamylcyclotransferase (GGCT)/AIG2-like uncharacterized protein YtfP
MRTGGLGTDCLFVYGTLTPVSSHPMALRLASESASLGPATMSGRLYDLGDYPGAAPSADPADRVHGMAVRLRDPAESLRWLDAYEGCGEGDAEPHAYQRVIASALLKSGQAIDAWIYYYRWPLGSARHLPSGCYVMPKPLALQGF